MDVINTIKTYLLELQSFDDIETFGKLQDEVAKLTGKPGIRIGITPLFSINDKLIFSEIHNVNSILLKNLSSDEEKETVSKGLVNYFESSSNALVIEAFNEEVLLSYSFLEHIQRNGWKGIIICPLKNYNQLIGVLEIVSEENGELSPEILNKIDNALPLFELALNRSWHALDARIDKIIKENFTAIQPSVEWRFTEAALNYLVKSEQEEDTKMETILFDNVHPLYGAIDIRNSSTERNKAIQLDMLEQLDMAAAIIEKASQQTDFPVLNEVLFKIKKIQTFGF